MGLKAQPDQPSAPPFLPWPRPGLRRACQRPGSAEGPSGINSFNSVSILQCSYKVGIIIRHLLQIQKLFITDSRKGILDLRVRPRARLEPSATRGRSEKHQVHARGMADSSPPTPLPRPPTHSPPCGLPPRRAQPGFWICRARPQKQSARNKTVKELCWRMSGACPSALLGGGAGQKGEGKGEQSVKCFGTRQAHKPLTLLPKDRALEAQDIPDQAKTGSLFIWISRTATSPEVSIIPKSHPGKMSKPSAFPSALIPGSNLASASPASGDSRAALAETPVWAPNHNVSFPAHLLGPSLPASPLQVPLPSAPSALSTLLLLPLLLTLEGRREVCQLWISPP